MEWLDVLNRISVGEDDQTEFKRGAGDLKAIGRTISAFANTTGGLLVLGVENAPSHGRIVGVKEPEEKVSERVTSFLQSGLSSPVQARLGRQLDPSGWVHWIEVPRQRGFEPLRFEGRVWVRRARASVEPSPTELQSLYNLFGYVLTEERTIEAATASDIDAQSFREFLARQGLELGDEPQPSFEEDLRNRGVLVETGGDLHATLYGVLAFGRNPQNYPQTRSFWIECVAYAGLDRSDEPFHVAEAKGRLDEQVSRAVGWMRSLGHGERYEGLRRTDVPLVPDGAIREALVNAVAHRDYAVLGSRVLLEAFEDRIVVTSPGTLPNHMSPASVLAGGHPRSRNELIANYFLAMGFMESRGRGWPRMRRLMREHNGTEPRLEEDVDGAYVRTTFLTSASASH